MTKVAPHAPPRRAAWLWAAAILAAAAAIFLGTLSSPFVHDDLTVIGENPLVQESGRALEAFAADYWAMREGDEGRDRLYRPLTILTLAANRALGGNAPEGYRALNIFLHALASALLFWLGLRFGLGRGQAGAAALLFALHPVHTEAVNAVVARADLMAAIGVLGGMGLLLGRALPAPLSAQGAGRGEGAPAPDGGLALPLGAGALFLLALLSKEIGAALLLWAGLWWLWCRAGGAPEAPAGERGHLLRASLAMGAALALYLALRYGALGMWLRARPPSLLDNPLAHAAAGERLLGALGVLGRYLKLLVWPWPLSIDYSYAQVLPGGEETALWAAGGALALLLWGWAAWRWRREAPWAAFGLSLFLAGWLPVGNLVAPIGTVMAERLIYLPSAGFLLAAAPAAGALLGRWDWRAPAGALAVLALLSGGLSWKRNQEWADPLRLWESAARASPKSARALRLYGQYLYRRGSFEEAIPPLLEATRIYPLYDPAWVDLGIAQMQSRREEEAEVSLKRALGLNPRSPEGHLSLGALYMGTNRLIAARPHLERAVALSPRLVEARFNLGTLYLKEGQRTLAIGQFQAALALEPDRGDAHHNLAIALYLEGDEAGARRHAREADRLGVRLHPALAKTLGVAPAP